MPTDDKNALPLGPWSTQNEPRYDDAVWVLDADGHTIAECYGSSEQARALAELLLRAPGVEAAARELIGAMDRLDYAGNPEQLFERLRAALGDAK